MKNSFEVDFTNNDDLRAAFAAWEIGKTYELQVKLQLDERDESRAICTIKEVVLPETAETTEGGKEIEPDGDEPVMMVMVAGRGGEKTPYVKG